MAEPRVTRHVYVIDLNAVRGLRTARDQHVPGDMVRYVSDARQVQGLSEACYLLAADAGAVACLPLEAREALAHLEAMRGAGRAVHWEAVRRNALGRCATHCGRAPGAVARTADGTAWLVCRECAGIQPRGRHAARY